MKSVIKARYWDKCKVQTCEYHRKSIIKRMCLCTFCDFVYTVAFQVFGSTKFWLAYFLCCASIFVIRQIKFDQLRLL